MKSRSEMYSCTVVFPWGQTMVAESSDIHEIIFIVQAAINDGYKVRVSPETKSKLLEMQRDETREMN